MRPAPSVDIVPYVRPPEEIVPGKPLFFATAMTLGGGGVGLLVESHLGRPTKIEGNPDHPASRGATDLFHQASVLTLYDPGPLADRHPPRPDAHLGRRRSPRCAPPCDKQRERRGAGLRMLTETVVSPTLDAADCKTCSKQFPEAKWHQYEPLAPRLPPIAARELAFGEPVNTVLRFHARPTSSLSLDADFLTLRPGQPALRRRFHGAPPRAHRRSRTPSRRR